MEPGAAYRAKAAEIEARARVELDPVARAELKHLAMSYLRLAVQAERNALNDVVYEPPFNPPVSGQHVAQQQQQAQQTIKAETDESTSDESSPASLDPVKNNIQKPGVE
jgi:hypothetical protein